MGETIPPSSWACPWAYPSERAGKSFPHMGRDHIAPRPAQPVSKRQESGLSRGWGWSGGFTLWGRRQLLPPRAELLKLHGHCRLWLRGQGCQTHVHNEEVKPAPGVGEVHLEAVCHPLEQHLHDEDIGEDLVGVLQDGADDWALLNVDVFKGLGDTSMTGGWPED